MPTIDADLRFELATLPRRFAAEPFVRESLELRIELFELIEDVIDDRRTDGQLTEYRADLLVAVGDLGARVGSCRRC